MNMNGYIAIEEAIAIPGLADRRPPIPLPDNNQPEFVDHVMARLPDVTQFRLPDMDANRIAMQVLSLTVPASKRTLTRSVPWTTPGT